ncbi:MAG: DUF4177 domain-containing protein [Actinomycetota bacterium]
MDGTPPTWEYTTIVVPTTWGGKEKLKRSRLQKDLDKAGDEGWELVNAWLSQNLEGESDGHLLIFKRQAR